MKKIWKYILITTLVLMIVGAGTLYYLLKIKTYDVADREVEEITNSEYEIILPGQKEPVIISKNGEKAEDTETSPESDNVTNTDGVENNNSNTSHKDKNISSSKSNSQKSNSQEKDGSTQSEQEIVDDVTVASIKEMYTPTFKNLEAQASGKIDSLVSKAIGEYQMKKNNGESISYVYFFQKYNSAGKNLESQTDSAFNYIYNALENELKKNGFSAAHAKSFKEQYEKEKNAREAALFSKAKGAI